MTDWYSCDHEWQEKGDSMWNNDKFTEVKCVRCGCVGEKTNATGDVYWPTT